MEREFDVSKMYTPLPQQKRFHESKAKYKLLGGSVGGGKRLSNGTKVFTNSGWKTVEDITYTDMLLASDGTYTKILGIFPHSNMPTYRITFSDGRWVDADAEHSWYVKGQKHGSRDGWLVKTTEEILNVKEKQVIPLCDTVPGKKWEGPDPYICGLLLGDGTLTGHYTTVYTVDKEIIGYLKVLGWHIYKYESQNTTMCQYFSEDFRNILGKVSGKNKRVPESLLMADPETRLAVLQGLMDTDGYCDKARTAGCSFTNKSKQLCEDLIYLVRSLGGKATLHFIERGRRSVKGYETDGEYYRVNVSHLGKFMPFRLTRKAKRVNTKQKGNSLGIKSIKKVGNTDGVCFEVEHPSHLFVVKDFIVTHNTIAIIWEAIIRSISYDFPTTTAIFRRSYPELDATIIKTMLEILPRWFYKYNQSQHVMTLTNGSRIEFCYAENDNDVIRYQSREWDFLGIDELTHFSLYQFTYLLTRLRTTKPLKTKFFAATNPGSIGHSWVKGRWITKDCKDKGYSPEEYDFIPAGIKDNPYLMKANPDYLINLENLLEHERRALLYGDWDVYQGQFFTEFDRSVHVVKPFEIPDEWRILMSWDEGTRHARSVHLYAIDNDQRVWCFWEYYRTGENLKEGAENIRAELKRVGLWDKIYKCVVDSAMNKPGQEGLTDVQILEEMGFGFKVGNIELANKDREMGWRIVKAYLSHKEYEEPLLKFFSTVDNMIRTIPELIYYSPKSGADSKKEDLDTSQEDDAADDLRYLLVSLDRIPDRLRIGSSYNIEKRGYTPFHQ